MLHMYMRYQKTPMICSILYAAYNILRGSILYAAYNILRGSLENITLSKNVRYPLSRAPSLKSG